MAMISLLMLLSACASTPSGKIPLDTKKPAATLVKKCASVVDIPFRDLSKDEVERLWGQDRKRSVLCGVKHSGLVDYVVPLVADLQEAGAK